MTAVGVFFGASWLRRVPTDEQVRPDWHFDWSDIEVGVTIGAGDHRHPQRSWKRLLMERYRAASPSRRLALAAAVAAVVIGWFAIVAWRSWPISWDDSPTRTYMAAVVSIDSAAALQVVCEESRDYVSGDWAADLRALPRIVKYNLLRGDRTFSSVEVETAEGQESVVELQKRWLDSTHYCLVVSTSRPLGKGL